MGFSGCRFLTDVLGRGRAPGTIPAEDRPDGDQEPQHDQLRSTAKLHSPCKRLGLPTPNSLRTMRAGSCAAAASRERFVTFSRPQRGSASAAGVPQVRKAPFDSSLRGAGVVCLCGARSVGDCGIPPVEIRRLVGPAPFVLPLGFRNVGPQAHDSHSSNVSAAWNPCRPPPLRSGFHCLPLPDSPGLASRCRPTSGVGVGGGADFRS